MSGPSDLARLTDTIDTVDELLLSDEVKMMDVGNGVMRPANAKVQADLSTQLSGAMIYATAAHGLAGTVSGGCFSVPSDDSGKYVTLYRSDSGIATKIDDYPSASTVAALKADDNAMRFGPLEIKHTDLPGIYVTTDEGEVLQTLSDPGAAPAANHSLPFEGGLLFHPTIAVPENGELSIHVNNMLAHRDRSASVVASIASMTTGATGEGQVLRLEAQRFGSSAVIHLRPADNPDGRISMALKVLKVPIQSPLKQVKVLLIGDSIVNRQGSMLLKAYLEKLGFTPTMIGTLRGSASPTNIEDFTGEPGEGREGWETGDFTADIIDRLRIVVPGAEAAYMAMGKSEKQRKNPFVRAATGADPLEIVRNGYVFDPAFYQARFGLETPDIVINALGTNDVRDRTAETIAGHVYANDILMYKQIHAAWPNARIVRSLPGTAFSSDRNALWTTHYTPMIRAMRHALADYANAKVYMAPTWALVSSEAGYPLPTSNPDIDGFLPGNFLNTIHPEGAGRHGLYEALATYVAAAALSLG